MPSPASRPSSSTCSTCRPASCSSTASCSRLGSPRSDRANPSLRKAAMTTPTAYSFEILHAELRPDPKADLAENQHKTHETWVPMLSRNDPREDPNFAACQVRDVVALGPIAT